MNKQTNETTTNVLTNEIMDVLTNKKMDVLTNGNGCAYK